MYIDLVISLSTKVLGLKAAVAKVRNLLYYISVMVLGTPLNEHGLIKWA